MTDIETLRPLIDRVLERAARPCQRERAELLARSNALLPVPRAPVIVSFELIPGEHWHLMLGEDHVKCQADDARALEWRLRRDLWADEHIPHDHPLWPVAWVTADYRQVVGWGVDLSRHAVGGGLTAWAYDPPLRDGIDVSRLTMPEFEHHEEGTRRRVERMEELVEGRLAVRVAAPHLGHNMFDIAVLMRGMDAIMVDCALEPAKVHALMEFITEAHVRHHRARAEAGLTACAPTPCGRYQIAPWPFYMGAYLPEGFGERAPRLEDEWAYVSAQTSAGLGPAMYAELVHPYNCRAAELFDDNVYYHGCEPLDGKFETLRSLPNLRRIHVSPWSSPAVAREVFGRTAVLEIHAHPTEVFFSHTPETMREELRRKLDLAGDCRLDLNLNDIHSINGNPDTLTRWAQTALELSEEYGAR